VVKLIFKTILFFTLSTPIYAVTSWWNTDWHYRVALNINSAVINQVGKLNIDFTALGLSGDLDENSIRIVGSNGVLLSKQEFTDVLYANATDALNNARGEVKFILEDSGTISYYLYYDTVENGLKTALASSYVINGNFEHSSGTTPTGWTVGSANIGTNLPNNEVHPTLGEGSTVSINSNTVTNTAHTGTAFHLHGYRDRDESSSQKELVYIEKQFTVPGSSSGNLSYWFRIQAFDDINYDYVQVSINGTVINHNNLNINNSSLSVTSTKYGRSNTYGGYIDAGWTNASLDLSTYAGQTITLRISHFFATDNFYRSWELLDDLEWSLNTNITIGTQEIPLTAILNITKNSCVIYNDIDGTTNPKRINGATIRYSMEVSNSGGANADNVIASDTLDSTFDTTSIENLQIQDGVCDCLGIASASNNGANGTANGVNPVKLDFGTVAGGSVATPTVKCGYFEVKVL